MTKPNMQDAMRVDDPFADEPSFECDECGGRFFAEVRTEDPLFFPGRVLCPWCWLALRMNRVRPGEQP